LGAILYEILTLERPVDGKTVTEVLLKVSDGKIVPPEERAPDRGTPKELSAVAMKAMEKNRRRRYQSVSELAQDIRLFLEGRAVSAREDTLIESVVKLVKRNKGISVALAGALLAISALAALSYVRVMKERDRALASEQKAIVSERDAVKAKNKMHANALETSRQLALQAVRAAEQGRWAEAELRAEAAVSISPADGPWGAYAQGMVHKERKEFERAEELLKRALVADAEHAPSIAALGEVQSSLGRLRDAVALVERIEEIKDWRTLMAAGEALYGSEEYRHAQAAFERTLEQMGPAKDVPTNMRQLVDERLEHTEIWLKCEGFWESTRDLQPTEQAEHVRSKLEELHGRKISVTQAVKEGALTEMELRSPVTHLQPLKGLSLSSLPLHGGAVRDLSPLRGMPLRELNVHGMPLHDLSPLRGIPLSYLNLAHCPQVSDLSPLRAAKLSKLILSCATLVSDISPLEGMPLKRLSLQRTRASDVDPLHGMPLEFPDLSYTPVHDLGPLKGAPLEELNLHFCQRVKSIEPLRGLPIKTLTLIGTAVKDLSPLEGMPLSKLASSHLVRDLRPLRGMSLTSLSLLNARSVRDIGPLQGMPLNELDLRLSGVQDLSPLQGMPLKRLAVTGTPARDLTPLRGAPLEALGIGGTDVSDLTPLKGMHLLGLTLTGTKVTDLTQLKDIDLDDLRLEGADISDLSPLEGAKLRKLTLDPGKAYKGIEAVRQMETIQEIGTSVNRMKPEEFWKKYDAGEFK